MTVSPGLLPTFEPIAIAGGVRRGQEVRAAKNEWAPAEKAQRQRFFAPVFAAGREPHRRNHAHELDRIERARAASGMSVRLSRVSRMRCSTVSASTRVYDAPW
jgi:hypothetical protein